MENTGSQGLTPHDAVTNGSFGQSLNTINGGVECSDTRIDHRKLTVSRLDKYCKAVNGVGAELLTFEGCANLQMLYDSCISGGSGAWGPCASCDESSPTTSE